MPRIGPSGALSPSASRSARRSGRSHTKFLSFTRHWRCSREIASAVSGSASAIRRTSSKLATPRRPRSGLVAVGERALALVVRLGLLALGERPLALVVRLGLLALGKGALLLVTRQRLLALGEVALKIPMLVHLLSSGRSTTPAAYRRMPMRILFTFAGGAGHFEPLVPVAHAAAAAGHDVAFTCAAGMLEVVERRGFSALQTVPGELAEPPQRRPLVAADRRHEQAGLRRRVPRAPGGRTGAWGGPRCP